MSGCAFARMLTPNLLSGAHLRGLVLRLVAVIPLILVKECGVNMTDTSKTAELCGIEAGYCFFSAGKAGCHHPP